MAKGRCDSRRVFRRKPGRPWDAWFYEIDAQGVRRRTRLSTGQLDKQAAIAMLVERERGAAQAPHGLAADAAGRTVADAPRVSVLVLADRCHVGASPLQRLAELSRLPRTARVAIPLASARRGEDVTEPREPWSPFWDHRVVVDDDGSLAPEKRWTSEAVP